MKIPSSFTLGAVIWKVVVIEHSPDNQGHTDSRTATILIEKNPNKRVMEQTFMHELNHAIKFSTGKTEHDEGVNDAEAVFWHQYLVQVYDKKGLNGID